jgi:hypothetical protein
MSASDHETERRTQFLEIELKKFVRLNQHQSLKKFLRHPWRDEDPYLNPNLDLVQKRLGSLKPFQAHPEWED